MQLVALPAHLNKELDDVGAVHKVSLVGNTPHEEQGHLWGRRGRGGGRQDRRSKCIRYKSKMASYSVEVFKYHS